MLYIFKHVYLLYLLNNIKDIDTVIAKSLLMVKIPHKDWLKDGKKLQCLSEWADTVDTRNGTRRKFFKFLQQIIPATQCKHSQRNVQVIM